MRKSSANKIGILHLRDSPWFDGPGRTILNTANYLDPTRFDYFIGAFCPKGANGHGLIEEARRRGLNVIEIEESRSLDAAPLLQICRTIREKQVDILHTHETRSDILGFACGKVMNIPVVSTLHGWIENGFRHRALTSLDRKLLRYFDHVIAVSEKLKSEILAFGTDERKISVLRNSLVMESYTPGRNPDFRRELGADENTVLIGNIGRLSPEKGQADLIKATATVLKQFRNVRFVFIGNGKMEARLKEMAIEMGIGGSVVFTGFISDMQKVYTGLDLVVQTSYTEGMPNVILEALAMELPVIATDVGGTAEAVRDNFSGILIQPGDPDLLARKIIDFIRSPDEMKKLGIAGRNLVKGKFSMENRTAMLGRIYEQLASKMKRPPER